MNFERLPRSITIGDKYDPAMKVTTPAEAAECFARLVEHSMLLGLTKEKAVALEKLNLGYFAGYYDQETRLRVERLFECEHPVFGKAIDGRPTMQQAFNAGLRMARGGS